MCGRYALSATAEQLIDAFQLSRCPEYRPRYNIAPTSSVPVIRQDPTGDRVADLLRWGLVPHWAKDPSMGARMNNARGETVAEKPSFRSAFQRRRCLVPMSGFYEWHTEGKIKSPHYIHARDGALLAMGGLWESWTDPASGEILRTFTIITTAPNAVMLPIHDRMPVLVEAKDHARWLDPTVSGEGVSDLIVPAPDALLEAYPVSRRVSNAREEGQDLTDPLQVSH